MKKKLTAAAAAAAMLLGTAHVAAENRTEAQQRQMDKSVFDLFSRTHTTANGKLKYYATKTLQLTDYDQHGFWFNTYCLVNASNECLTQNGWWVLYRTDPTAPAALKAKLTPEQQLALARERNRLNEARSDNADIGAIAGLAAIAGLILANRNPDQFGFMPRGDNGGYAGYTLSWNPKSERHTYEFSGEQKNGENKIGLSYEWRF